jgi:predicted metallopeptidase
MAKPIVADDEEQGLSDKGSVPLPKWSKRDDIKPIVSELIQKYPELLSHLRPSSIGYLAFSKKRSSFQAKIHGIRPMYAILHPDVEYILTVHLENWMQLDISEKYVLILHELLHIPQGGFDADSKEYHKCVKHDIQDFSYILTHFGINWEDASKIMKKAKDEKVETE